jgi:hypothetical protein
MQALLHLILRVLAVFAMVLPAKAVDSAGWAKVSAARLVTINPQANPPPPTNPAMVVSLNSPTNGASFLTPTNLPLNATATHF